MIIADGDCNRTVWCFRVTPRTDFFGKAFDTALTKSPLTWVASSMPLIVQFWLIVTLLSVPEFAFTLPLISAFFAVSSRLMSGKMPEDYRRW